MRIIVHGTPAGQGSKRHVGHGVMIESSKRTRPWREHVHQAALDARGTAPRIETPVDVTLTFYFDRPRSHYRTGRNADQLRDDAPMYPHTRASGDTDKLARACLDSLVTAGVLKDDSQVVWLIAAKRYVVDRFEAAYALAPSALTVPGAVIEIMACAPITVGGAA